MRCKLFARTFLLSLLLLLMVGTVSAINWGYDSVGTSGDYYADYAYGYNFTAPSDISGATLVSLHFYSPTTANNLSAKGAIWNLDGTLVANSVTNSFFLNGLNNWVYGNFSAQPILTPGTAYYIGIATDGSKMVYYRYVAGTATYWIRGTVNYATPGSFSIIGTTDNKMSIYIVYIPAVGGDTTPSASITGLSNITTCQNTTLSWDNPVDADFNDTIWRQDDVIVYYADNITTSHLFEGLSELTEYAFSGQTCDIIGNCNETAFGNMSVMTDTCPVPTTEPTTSPTTTATTVPPTTTTASPTPTPTPTPLAGCTYFNLTGVTFGENSTDWNVTENLNTWGVSTFNATQGNVSWWICRATPAPTILPTWQPLINPSTDIKTDWLELSWQWWWLPVLIFIMILLFRRK